MFLRELFEAPKKVAVAAFGRMNPPTIGHEKLVDKVKSFEGDHYIFLSQTQKPKDNPLPFDVKLEFAKKFFPGVNVGHPSVRTPIQMLQMLEKLGYTDIIYVAGSDRVASFEKLFNDYNGKEYNFDSITVENAGERDPDADGAEGMSASKMRAAAAAGDFEAFAQGVPTPALAQKMYDAVRTGMGIKDKETAEDVSPKDEKKFHNELDDLVHKYFGDSPDEEKMKKKMRKVKEARKIDTSNYKLVKKSDKVELYINKKDPSNAIAILDDGAWDGTMMDDNDGWEFEKRRTSGLHGYFHVDDLKDLFDPNFDESVNEGDLVIDKGSIRQYLASMIADAVAKEDDIEKLSKVLKMLVGKQIKTRGKRYTITAEDILEACKRKRRG